MIAGLLHVFKTIAKSLNQDTDAIALLVINLQLMDIHAKVELPYSRLINNGILPM